MSTQQQQRYATFAPKLAALGYDVTPLKGKRPILDEWQTRPECAKDFPKYGSHNIGVVLGGPHNVIAVDVDVTNPFAANEIESIIEETLGYAPKRIGKAPKFLMVFRANARMQKKRTAVFEIDKDDCAVEILAEGQQFVASGIHPDTKAKYVWPNDSIMDISPSDLPEVDLLKVITFLTQCEEIMSRYGHKKGRDGIKDRQPPSNVPVFVELEAAEDEVAAALVHISNDDLHYDDWIHTAHAIKGSLGNNGLDLFHRWSKRSAKYDAAETDRAWDSITRVDKVGAGTLFYLAKQEGFDIAEYRDDKKQEAIDAAHITPEKATQAIAAETDTREDISTQAWLKMPIPPRDYILGEVMCTTSRWMIYGQTGLGKTLFAMNIAAGISTAATVMGWTGVRPSKVMYLDGEMPAETFKERIVQVSQLYGKGVNIYGYNRDTEGDDSMPPLNTQEGEAWLWKEIAKIKPDVIVFDSIMCLLGGDMKEEESWEPVKTLIRTITSQRIAQIWMHHAGHNASQAYGTSTRTWEMDTVIRLEKTEQEGTSFQYSFEKARLRTPKNEHQFTSKIATLTEFDGWDIKDAPNKGSNGRKGDILRAVEKQLLTSIDTMTCHITEGNHRGKDGKPVKAADMESVIADMRRYGVLLEDEKGNLSGSARATLLRAKNSLVEASKIYIEDKLIWKI